MSAPAYHKYCYAYNIYICKVIFVLVCINVPENYYSSSRLHTSYPAWVPEVFLTRFPVSVSIVTLASRAEAKGSISREKKPLVPRVQTSQTGLEFENTAEYITLTDRRLYSAFCWIESISPTARPI